MQNYIINDAKLLKNFYALQETHAADADFHCVCMNLTGNKNVIETKAAELIEKYGIKKALKLSKLREDI